MISRLIGRIANPPTGAIVLVWLRVDADGDAIAIPRGGLQPQIMGTHALVVQAVSFDNPDEILASYAEPADMKRWLDENGYRWRPGSNRIYDRVH